MNGSQDILRSSLQKIQLKPRKRLFTTTAPSFNLPPLTRRLFKLPHPPAPPSQHHHDLPSFQAYTAHISLPESSPTYIGTHYEYTVQQALRAAGLSLHRIGGRDDAGVDLVGTWHLPTREHPVRVLVQCKALRTKAGPNLVRELEGAFRSSPPVGWRTGVQKVGVLVCQREATKGVREALARSAYPLAWMMVERGGIVRQALWNGAVEQLGLGLLGVEVVYASDGGGQQGEVKGRIGFTWDGVEVPHMDRVEEDMLRVQKGWFGLWGDLNERARADLLDVVEELHPEEKPLLTAKGLCSTLSDADRARVLEVLHSRMDRSEGRS